jgi:hypothetical protein
VRYVDSTDRREVGHEMANQMTKSHHHFLEFYALFCGFTPSFLNDWEKPGEMLGLQTFRGGFSAVLVCVDRREVGCEMVNQMLTSHVTPLEQGR